MKDVVILSPNRFSLYTICVTELLRRNNANINAIIVRRLFNPKRFTSEFTRDGSRLIKKIWKKFVLRKNAYQPASYETILDLMKSENIRFSKVEDFNEKFEIPVIYCNTLNDPVVVEMLKKSKPDIVVFTGGGLIRSDVLENSGAGVLNCHMGVLPQYRGMDVVEWPLLEDNFDEIGMTVHLMDKGVDTGDILQIKKVKLETNEGIKQLRERFEPIMCRQMVTVCLDYLNGRIDRIPQKLEDGKQYFIMHSRLIEIAGTKMKQKMAE
ncbi:formyltransferase family protein [Candidatus Electrothrix sp.]|uniref:formyltransferase family protein n=1 Tax=Candidatus Electrothrix sp. TaxID=2170559 RepID=UPI004056FEF3